MVLLSAPCFVPGCQVPVFALQNGRACFIAFQRFKTLENSAVYSLLEEIKP